MPEPPHSASHCPKCGLRLKDHTPHTLDDCIKELRHCHQIATDALQKVAAIIQAFTADPKILRRIQLIVQTAEDKLKT